MQHALSLSNKSNSTLSNKETEEQKQCTNISGDGSSLINLMKTKFQEDE